MLLRLRHFVFIVRQVISFPLTLSQLILLGIQNKLWNVK